jgi:hypothetical protein
MPRDRVLDRLTIPHADDAPLPLDQPRLVAPVQGAPGRGRVRARAPDDLTGNPEGGSQLVVRTR